MSVTMDQGADALLQAAHAAASLEDELSVVDEDGSSSLSEIEDKDADQDDDGEGSDELSNMSEEENDSEAETERIEESPHKFRAQKDVVLSSRNDDHGYERTPSKLHKHFTADDDDDDEPLSDADVSMGESPVSPKSSAHEDAEPGHTTGPTSLEDSSTENKTSYSTVESDTRKRKRSIMAGSGLEEEIGEPVRKRTGSIMTPGDDYVIEEDVPQEEDQDALNPTSGNISGDDGGVTHEEEVVEEAEEHTAVDEEAVETVDVPISPRKRGRKKKKGTENGVNNHVEDLGHLPDPEATTNGEDARQADEDNADNEGDDEAEAAQRNEEEPVEKKRIALDQLTSIERQFSTFRDRLHEERLEQLNREDAMLRQDPPTHPEYLAMMRCVDARRDERIRIANTLRDYQIESLKRSAVSHRSQILSQYQQEVREIREKKQEFLGKQWYDMLHDRRNHVGSIPDYTLKFPTRRSQQVMNQVAYSNEVSLLSGIAKYVGFPAAPMMAPATMSELEEDLEKMGRTRHAQQVHQGGIPLQELAALRTAGSTSRFKPAEEQFIEQTPWANPQHPSHAHLLQRQTSAQQVPRTTSPFSSQPQSAPRRHSHQQGAGVPISGTFSSSNSSLLQHSKSLAMSGGRISPHNPFNSNHSHTIVPSPLGSRQASPQLPHLNRAPQAVPSKAQQDGPKSNGIQHSPTNGLTEIPRDFPPEVRREQAAAIMGRI
ncbi:hypothetical protein HYFRA_00008589 [Hymenoscyphus fraxineus]|uniref:Transcriptional regulatory protein DEP1 n=1 Tax=Hymenoscyphus fraxineus TaxID=746836 RepID=A0A9N9KZN5_9HELO|nr:hypothetical protein HYFRA_00008589 [Hymenoscyphus fraxineus]